MRSLILCVAVSLLLSLAPAWGQPPAMKKGDTLAPSPRPGVYRASAAEEAGEIVVRISWPSLRLTTKDKKGKIGVLCWEDAKLLTLGKEVQAFSQAGKRLGKDAVLKALAKQVPVACFLREYPDDSAEPDPVYTAVFRDDTVLLVCNATDIRPSFREGQPPTMAKREKLAPSLRPHVHKATAAAENGEVVVRITQPIFKVTETKAVYCWADVKPLTLGKEVQAYSQAGKRLGTEAVLKALAKQVSVACFVWGVAMFDGSEPDSVDMAVFRKDTVLLVYKTEDTIR